MRWRTAVALGLGLTATPVAADPALVEQGRQVLEIGGCAHCHTAKGGAPLAGGDPLVTPFGTFRAPNITSHPEAGIGGWSEADLIRAMREGRSPDGAPYYPAFPYTSYTRMTDQDLHALKAYLDSVAPVAQPAPPHQLSFPYDQRWGLYAWQWAFFEPGRFAPDPAKDAVWNRGAYLVQGPGHCTECHTPRNFAGALETDRAFAGAPHPAGKGNIPNISGNRERGLGNWSAQEVATTLTLGMLPDGDFVAGDMGKVVDQVTSKLPPADLQAIVTYLKSLPPTQ